MEKSKTGTSYELLNFFTFNLIIYLEKKFKKVQKFKKSSCVTFSPPKKGGTFGELFGFKCCTSAEIFFAQAADFLLKKPHFEMPHGPRKRPAANVKLEPDSTPSKRKLCSVPAEGTEREEAMPEQGTMPEEDNGAAGAAASLAEASPVPEEGSVPVPKAKAAAAKTMSKPAEELIAPGKEAWKDVHAQCTKLAKQGDNRLRSLGQGKGGWDTEGKEVILVQCIPSMSKKAIHKESLERLPGEGDSSQRMAHKVPDCQTAAAPDFAVLAGLAVQGLEERPRHMK